MPQGRPDPLANQQIAIIQFHEHGKQKRTPQFFLGEFINQTPNSDAAAWAAVNDDGHLRNWFFFRMGSLSNTRFMSLDRSNWLFAVPLPIDPRRPDTCKDTPQP